MTETLDYYVLKTLDDLGSWKIPKLKIRGGFNLFMGSGNAFQVAKIFAKKYGGVAADSCNYKNFAEKKERFDDIFIISASGGKDAVGMAMEFTGATLLTTAENPPAGEYLEKIIRFPANKEPPTYNISTYASMFYALEKPDLEKIRKYLTGLKVPELRKYSFVPFISSNEYEPVAQMCATKIRETLGIGSVGKGFSEAMHGWFLHKNKNELLIGLNIDNFELAQNVFILKQDSYLGAILSVYYIIGKNQTPGLTKEILENYEKSKKMGKWKFGDVV